MDMGNVIVTSSVQLQTDRDHKAPFHSTDYNYSPIFDSILILMLQSSEKLFVQLHIQDKR